MDNIKKFYFFRCYHCGEWYYSWKQIQKKKCWKCNKTFTFKNSSKFSQECSTRQAIEISKRLKEKKKEHKSQINDGQHFYSITKFEL
ncbi:MAG: DUF1922 domain-containing protein [Candidatus Lokiarchaeota archaeon]|nr:DUF1922 domain-containing protein [Candidatus Lokiarchaeota archaeon]